MATIPLCFEFFRCRVGVLQSLRSPAYSFAVLCSPLWLMFVLYVFWGRRSFKDPICPNSCMILSSLEVGFGQSFIFSARHQLDTWTLAPPPAKDTLSYYMWVLLRVLGQGLNQSARIFFIRFYSGCYAILTSPKKGETAVYGYNPALF